MTPGNHILDEEFSFFDLSANTQSFEEIREHSRLRDGALFLSLCPQCAAEFLEKLFKNTIYNFVLVLFETFMLYYCLRLRALHPVCCVQLQLVCICSIWL